MKLHLADTAGANVFTACADDFVAINGQRREGLSASGFIALPERIVEHWTLTTIATLDDAAIAVLRDLGVPIVLLGTGRKQVFPPPAVRQALATLADHGIAVEIMTSAATCRTYNILVSEGRPVAAALLAED